MAEMDLTQVVRALRTQLNDAVKEGDDQEIRFEATAIELELNIGVKKSVEGKGGVRFWVLELGGGSSYSSESVQKVKLTLQPLTVAGGKVRIAGRSDENPLAGKPASE